MNLVTRFAVLAEKVRALVPGAVQVSPLDLDTHWPHVDALLAGEEWPFVRADVEASHAQPGQTSFVAHKEGVFAGFFTTHVFGDVGYLDMMIVHPAFRGRTVARPLYVAALEALHAAGAKGLVVHTTNDSARLVEQLGFAAGPGYTLLTRPPSPATAPSVLRRDVPRDVLVAADARLFGRARHQWMDAILACDDVQVRTDGAHVALLRPRAAGAFSLDGLYPGDPATLPTFLAALVGELGANHELMCFARTDGWVHEALLALGFEVPDFFVPIGPLTEWRQGDTGTLGRSAAVQTVLWL